MKEFIYRNKLTFGIIFKQFAENFSKRLQNMENGRTLNHMIRYSKAKI